MNKLFFLSLFMLMKLSLYAQPDAEETPPKDWSTVVTLGLNYNQTTLNNPPVGYGVNQAGGTLAFNVATNYDKGKNIWRSNLDWKFGLLRFGSGPLTTGSDQNYPISVIDIVVRNINCN